VRKLLPAVLALACLAVIGASQPSRVSADTQYFATFSGKTYRNNYGGTCPFSVGVSGPCYQGTWSDTSLNSGQQVYWVGVAEYGQLWQAIYYNPYAQYGWVDTTHRCTNSWPQTFPNYCLSQSTYVTTNGINYDPNFAHAAAAEHQDLWTGVKGWTSDGY
jgi:hypothetical protein